jgi:predicted RNA-binding Zn-ribbon protein involved in translation (DUF1610 family)
MEEQQRIAKIAPQPRHEVHPVAPGDFELRRAERRAARQAGDLHICPSCGSSLVYPMDWAPASGRRWSVDLRCPECEWTGGGTYNQKVVDRFDEALDDGTESILEDLCLLARANMEDSVEAFAAALWADGILPEDF